MDAQGPAEGRPQLLVTEIAARALVEEVRSLGRSCLVTGDWLRHEQPLAHRLLCALEIRHEARAPVPAEDFDLAVGVLNKQRPEQVVLLSLIQCGCQVHDSTVT